MNGCNSTHKGARSFLDLVLSADSDSEAPKASRSSPDQVFISEQWKQFIKVHNEAFMHMPARGETGDHLDPQNNHS